MELKEKRSVISRELKTLEPGSLYITISVPPRSGAHQSFSDFHYLPYLPHDLDLASYEVSCAEGIDKEEFDWGVYLHRGHGNGTWYGLRRLSSSIDASMGMGTASMGDAAASTATGSNSTGVGAKTTVASSRSMPFYTLSRQDMRQSPRLQARVAGLIRVLRVPSLLVAGLTSYLDWLAVQTASSATRSFIWASSMYLRARRHLSADHHPHDNGTGTVATGFLFDTKGFLQEALHLAYTEVWYGLAGQLPRPIMASAFGVELVVVAPPAEALTGTAVEAIVRDYASNDEEDPGAGARSAAEDYYYCYHQWGSRYPRSASEAGSSDDDSSTLVGDENMGLADAADSISIGFSA
ncbi:hypothetical protein TGAM01_v205258 [Trichoderma gamsii]|uniref:Uncharacterized protein n=1 Tax=Trichoderma gamsii TaxID=398673 RepID=A0A2P4ZNF2_9HYPO|nr:hypothetical protein TGAM01_v205258 [Trichoderma gamsii]PON25821.1 hypothetical protein TGAM01_v205258 [Trichoderma gamsii]